MNFKAPQMDAKETNQHVAVSIEGENENMEESNKRQNDKAKGPTTSKNSVYGWLNFLEKHSSIERKVILFLSVAAVSLDPLFFYVPVVKNASTCLGLDSNLRVIVVVFRSFVDLLHTILWWHHSTSSVHGRNMMFLFPVDGYRRLLLAWTITILAILPLPQVVIFAVSWQILTVKLLKFIVLIQLVLRLYRILPAYKDATRSSDMLHIYMWFAAAFNLVMYTLASNVLGAFWYLRAVERNMDCWSRACHKNGTLCVGSSLYCDGTSSYKEYLHNHCSIPQASSTKFFDYGIYDEAFQTIIIETDTHFLDKFFQCFWWGLRNLSSLGQNLETGSYIWDSFFAISIAISGLVLFALLIGNMQTYLQTKTPAKLERMKRRKDNLEGWRPFYLVDDKDLRKEVTWCEDPKWQETTEINLESVLNNIPTALRKRLKPQLCKDMFSNIPQFRNLRSRPQNSLCNIAKPLVFPERSYIFNEGDPIYEVVYVVHGNLLSYSKYSIQNGVPPKRLSDGCFFGEEILQQLTQVAQQQEGAIDEPLDLPIASKTIQATTKVEAFGLAAKDLNKVFASYRGRLYESDVDWARVAIHAAWQKHAKGGKPQQGEKDPSIKE